MATPDAPETARCQVAGQQALSRGDYAAAADLLEVSVQASRDGGQRLDAYLLSSLALALLGSGRLDEAEDAYAEALRHALDPAGVAEAQSGLAFVAQQRQDYGAAVAAFRAAFEALERAGDARRAATTAVDLGGALYLVGDHNEAVRAWSVAVDGLRGWASPDLVARVQVNRGGVLHGLRRNAEALEALDEAAALLDGLVETAPSGAPRATLDGLRMATAGNRGLCLFALGRLDESVEVLNVARRIAIELGDVSERGRYAATLSDLHRIAGDLGLAVSLFEEAVELSTTHGFELSSASIFYVGLQDRSVWVSPDPAELDEGRQQRLRTAEGNIVDAVATVYANTPKPSERPFVVFAPPCPGRNGPVFPRGATAIASYLQAHGIPSLVVPLSHFIDLTSAEEVIRARLDEVVRDTVTSLAPLAVGISVTFSHLYLDGLEVARAVHAVDPDLPVIIGGPHVSYWDKECLEEAPEIDVVVRGEGEWTALELLRALDDGGDLGQVRGITWRDASGGVHRNQLRPLGNVLELPEIDFGLVPGDFARGMEVFALSSRGCTFRCKYCHEFRYWGGVVRQYPVERIVGELERLYVDHGNAMRGIDDSMLNMLEPYFLELMDALGRSPCLPERFGLLTRVDTITDEGLRAMERVGIPSLSVGMESGSDAVLEAMNKGVTLEQAMVGLERVRAYEGIDLSTFFIVGHPGDNPVEAAKTTRFVDRLFRDGMTTFVDLSLFTPLPGTPYFAQPERYGVRILTLDWRRWRRSNRPIAQLEDFSSNEIQLAYLRTLEVQARYRTAPATGSVAQPTNVLETRT